MSWLISEVGRARVQGSHAHIPVLVGVKAMIGAIHEEGIDRDPIGLQILPISIVL